jgi:hypothetical protein
MTDDEPYEMRCRCGTPSCRGTITGLDWLKPEIQEKYDGYFSWFIQRRIDAIKTPLTGGHHNKPTCQSPTGCWRS